MDAMFYLVTLGTLLLHVQAGPIDIDFTSNAVSTTQIRDVIYDVADAAVAEERVEKVIGHVVEKVVDRAVESVFGNRNRRETFADGGNISGNAYETLVQQVGMLRLPDNSFLSSYVTSLLNLGKRLKEQFIDGNIECVLKQEKEATKVVIEVGQNLRKCFQGGRLIRETNDQGNQDMERIPNEQEHSDEGPDEADEQRRDALKESVNQREDLKEEDDCKTKDSREGIDNVTKSSKEEDISKREKNPFVIGKRNGCGASVEGTTHAVDSKEKPVPVHFEKDKNITEEIDKNEYRNVNISKEVQEEDEPTDVVDDSVEYLFDFDDGETTTETFQRAGTNETKGKPTTEDVQSKPSHVVTHVGTGRDVQTTTEQRATLTKRATTLDCLTQVIVTGRRNVENIIMDISQCVAKKKNKNN